MSQAESGDLASDRRNVVVIGASAGGVEALRSLVASFPAGFPGAVVVAMHFPAGGTSALPTILGRSGPLPVVTAECGTRLQAGTIYVATPDRHLLVGADQLVVARGPTENGHRPAINALFRSAAIAHGPRAVGVVLSGVLDDGAAGLSAIASLGGAAFVQEPHDALYSAMPEAALRRVETEHVLPAGEMGPTLDKLAREAVDVSTAPQASPSLLLEDRIARHGGSVTEHETEGAGAMSGYTCPDCQGALIEMEPGSGNYRCRIGHAWSAEALHAAQGNELQRALWTALRSLDEKTSLSRRLEEDARKRGNHTLVHRYNESAGEASEAADVLRNYLVSLDPTPPEEVVS